MTRAISIILGVGLVASFAAAKGFPREFQEHAAVKESLSRVHPRMRASWLRERGIEDPYYTSVRTDSGSGVRCVGRWSYGPSTWVDVRATADDTIVFLSRGSGVSVIRFRSQDSLRLDLLSDINSRSLTGRCQVRDTLLFVNSGGIECYDISNLTSPVLLDWLSQPLIYDFFVIDTLLYTSSRDSFRIFSVANPVSPRWLGACADSGYVMYVSGNHAYLGHQAGLFILDVTNPAAPHRVSSLGYDVLSIAVRDTLLFFGTNELALRIYNVKDPTTPFPVGSLPGIEAHDICLPPTCDTVLYTPKLHVISIANPASPRQIGFVDCPGWDYGVRAVPALNYTLVADYFKGMVAVSIVNPTAPLVDTMAFAGDEALDITIDNGKAYLASYHAGLQILDVTDPTKPSYLGCYDTAGASKIVSSATARDSFAYVSWPVPRMLSVDVTDPHHPLRAAGCDGMFNRPEDMVIRDSFVYCAEASRFQVVNVARPREPVLVGSCVSTDGNYFGLAVQDSFAYEASLYGMWVISVAKPDSPFVVASNVGRNAAGIAARDTLVYLPAAYDTLWVYSVANPASPRVVGFAPLLTHSADVALADSTALVATSSGLEAFSLENPAQPRRRATISTPCGPRRVVYSAPYFYVAMWEAGVGIYRAESLGLQEHETSALRPAGLRVYPNPVRGMCSVALGTTEVGRARLRDVAGRVIPTATIVQREPSRGLALDMSTLPPGIYFMEVKTEKRTSSVKIVKQ
jgi:hypothetical protein